MTREQALADLVRAVSECFPDRAAQLIDALLLAPPKFDADTRAAFEGFEIWECGHCGAEYVTGARMLAVAENRIEQLLETHRLRVHEVEARKEAPKE